MLDDTETNERRTTNTSNVNKELQLHTRAFCDAKKFKNMVQSGTILAPLSYTINVNEVKERDG